MLIPRDEADLSGMIAAATEPLSIRGGATRGLCPEGTPLTLSGHRGITLYDPGALTIVASAGTPIAALEAALAAENQMLAFEPMDHRALLGTEGEPTIGGVVAANVSGPRRVQAGACRDFLLGVRCVDGSGTVIRNGGRVMKNVTGYDLARLMCGAHGTLGVLSEVSLKVLPKPEAEATLVLPGVSGLAALRAMADAMNSPFEVSGAAELDGAVHVRVEGFETSVRYRVAQLRERLSGHGDINCEDDPVASAVLWRAIRDVEALSGHAHVWRIAMKPEAAYADLLAPLSERLRFSTVVDRAGGQCWLGVRAEDVGDVTALHRDLQTRVGDGHATLVKSDPGVLARVARFQPEPEPLAAMARGLRARFDPKGILNPGLMG